MSISDKLVLTRQRHLKWRLFDKLELVLMMICGVALCAFSLSATLDITTGPPAPPGLWLQEAPSTLFIYGIFVGAAVAPRPNDHLYLPAVADALHGRSRLIVELIIR